MPSDVSAPAASTITDAGRRAGPRGEELAAGRLLAHFRLEERLGRGGMGEVWRATDLSLDRDVAIKVLPAAVARDPDRRERLLREARAQARLAHPNVCHIYYVGQDAGVVFFAMELVAGESLAQRLARGALAPDQAVEVVRQAALGLREAQRHGFLHRDVKPSNLMLDREGRVKVVDFGLVRAVGEAAAGDAADDDDAGTSSTIRAGTPHYMAPEQAAGAAIDARADIYALGATLHHLVSGQPPFQGASVDELVSQHRELPRPRLPVAGPRRERRAASTLDPVIARMMARRPEERFASYDALIGELERVSPAHTRPAGAFVRLAAVLVDVLVVALLLVPVTLVHEAGDHEAVALSFGALYAIVALSRWGMTVGRWLLDVEVIDVRTGGRPPIGRAALRTAVEYGPLWLVTVVSAVPAVAVDNRVIALVGIGAAGWGLLALARAAWVSPDKRTPWDRAGGTMVRYRARAPRT